MMSNGAGSGSCSPGSSAYPRMKLGAALSCAPSAMSDGECQRARVSVVGYDPASGDCQTWKDEWQQHGRAEVTAWFPYL